jgi:hypothetical protein
VERLSAGHDGLWLRCAVGTSMKLVNPQRQCSRFTTQPAPLTVWSLVICGGHAGIVV